MILNHIKLLLDFSSAFFMMQIIVFCWHKLLRKEFNLKDKRILIITFFLSIISLLNYYYVNQFIRIVVITFLFTVALAKLFDKKLIESIFTPIYTQFLFMISESIIILFIVLIFKFNVEELKELFLTNFFVNMLVSLCVYLIIHIPIVYQIHSIIIDYISKINRKFYIIIILILVSLANLLAMTTYYKIDLKIIILINFIFTLFCFLLVLYSFKTQSIYNIVSNKYDMVIKSINDYEIMINKYRISNHENKNILKSIGIMALENNDFVVAEYVEVLLKDKFEKNDILLLEMSSIPLGGLRATICSEILKIQSYNIKYDLYIDKKIKTINLINIDSNIVVDLCKIVGVLIDNAIDEVKNKKDKNKNIMISLFIDDNILNIKITNIINKYIDIEKIFEEGYTTKGENHGYGLSLIKEIIDNRKNYLNLTTEISKNIFSQIILLKIK